MKSLQKQTKEDVATELLAQQRFNTFKRHMDRAEENEFMRKLKVRLTSENREENMK